MKRFIYIFTVLALMFAVKPQQAQAQVNEYLQVVGNMTIRVVITGSPEMPDLWYSFDKSSWTQITEATTINKSKSYNWDPTPVCYFKGNNPQGFNKSATDYVSITITGGNPDMKGNVMSLIGGDNFSSLTSIPCDYCFYGLFMSNTDCLLNARELVLPATTLKAHCYDCMFKSNKGLASTPTLPATKMAPWCYAHMFENCINSLKVLPELPALELAEGCYAYMFNLCASLKMDDWYILPAEELAPSCYYQMFGLTMSNGNSTSANKNNGLKYVEIMATSLFDRCGNDINLCCARMFNYMIVNTTNTAYYGRGGLTLRFYWTNWGNGTTAASTATSTAPTCDWFTGLMSSYCTFQYQTGLNITTKASDNTSMTKAHTFPQSSTLQANNYTYLTFDCKSNGGTWEEGCNYNEDLRRVVRSDYKAKTVPADPVKTACAFKGWYTAPTGGTKVEKATILNQTTAQTYYAQFDAPETVEIYMPEGVLDIPTYLHNQFAIEGENDKYTVHLHFNTDIGELLTDYSKHIDLQESWIQSGNGAQIKLSEAKANVLYYGDAFRAAKLEATVKDVQGVEYHIVIFTNCGRNYGTFKDEEYVWGKRTSHLESSWDNMQFSFGENNHLEEIYLRGDNYLRYYHMDSDPYYVLHIQLQFFPDPTKPGKIPTGVYPINGTKADETVFIGRLPMMFPRDDDREYMLYQQNQLFNDYGSFVHHEYTGSYGIRYTGNWTLRSGYVEVVNVDETYYVHCYAHADANCQTDDNVIEFTSGGTADNPLTPVSVTFAAQTENGTALEGGVTVKLTNAQNWDKSAVWQAGTYKFFSGNQLTVNASLTGYTFSHWLVDGYRIDPVNGSTTYDYAVDQNATIIAVFKDGEDPDDPDDPGIEIPDIPIISADADVTVYQNVSKTTTKILYNLDPKQGKDGLTYTPVDLGTGVAWADRNVGATNEEEVGAYFRWGGIIPGGDERNNTFRLQYCYDVYGKNIIDGENLPAADDAATQIMGDSWRTPTADEWVEIKNNTDHINGYYSNQSDISQVILLPASGEYVVDYNSNTSYHYGNGACWYWSSTLSGLGVRYSYEWDIETPENYASTAYYYMDDGNASNVNVYQDGYIIYGMPVRAVYVPPFATQTLTIRVGNYEYRYICQYGQDVTVTAIATETGAEFVKWEEDGLTDATRTFTMDDDMTYTAIFTEQEEPEPEMSPDAEVSVYQSVTESTIKILYDLSPKQGKDGLWYTPVDLGYGVAWADRNVGASSPTDLGSRFRWGDPVARTSFSQVISDIHDYSTGSVLPANKDAAVVNMGTSWRTPDADEAEALKDNTLISSNNRFTNSHDPESYILLPAYGYQGAYGTYDQAYQYYWTREYATFGYSAADDANTHSCYVLARNGQNKYYIGNYDKDDYYVMIPGYGMPIRAIYVPQFTICTLTVNVEGYQYKYLCQKGQNVKVTAVPNNGYEFDKWTEDGNTVSPRTFTVTGNMTYTATFKTTEEEKYQVTFYDKADGVLCQDKWKKGEMPSCNLPSNTSDAEYRYTYAWDKDVVAVTGETEYHAVQTKTKQQYTLTWNMNGGTTASTPDQYTSGTIEWGTSITHPAEPTREGYDFDKWKDQNGNVVETEDLLTQMPTYDLTYTAQWKEQAAQTAVVRFVDWDGTELQKETLNYGETPKYNGLTPVRPADENGEYEFTGWTPTIGAVSGDVTYKAVYTPIATTDFDLVDDKLEGDVWYTTLAAMSGKTLNVRYVRSLPANEWLMFSLPFDFDLLMNSSHPFSGNVYSFESVTDENGYLNLNFLPETVEMTANRPYIYYNNSTNVDNPVFQDVTIKPLAANPYSVSMPSGGDVTYHNTTARIQLNLNDPLQFYIQKNKLYFSGKNVIWMRAFRGYFMLSELPQGVRPRVRIVLHGQTATAIETVEADEQTGDGTEVRKYIEDGVLIIERNGVQYNAQGAKVR